MAIAQNKKQIVPITIDVPKEIQSLYGKTFTYEYTGNELDTILKNGNMMKSLIIDPFLYHMIITTDDHPNIDIHIHPYRHHSRRIQNLRDVRNNNTVQYHPETDKLEIHIYKTENEMNEKNHIHLMYMLGVIYDQKHKFIKLTKAFNDKTIQKIVKSYDNEIKTQVAYQVHCLVTKYILPKTPNSDTHTNLVKYMESKAFKDLFKPHVMNIEYSFTKDPKYVNTHFKTPKHLNDALKRTDHKNNFIRYEPFYVNSYTYIPYIYGMQKTFPTLNLQIANGLIDHVMKLNIPNINIEHKHRIKDKEIGVKIINETLYIDIDYSYRYNGIANIKKILELIYDHDYICNNYLIHEGKPKNRPNIKKKVNEDITNVHYLFTKNFLMLMAENMFKEQAEKDPMLQTLINKYIFDIEGLPNTKEVLQQGLTWHAPYTYTSIKTYYDFRDQRLEKYKDLYNNDRSNFRGINQTVPFYLF